MNNESVIIKNESDDDKRFISKQMAKQIDIAMSKNIYFPLPLLYQNSRIIHQATPLIRTGASILQLSFLIVNKDNQVMLYKRSKRIPGTPGHEITFDDNAASSALVSVLPDEDIAPRSMSELLHLYRRKISRENERTKTPPEFEFLGVAKNIKTCKDDNGRLLDPISYYFYIFIAKYDCEGIPLKEDEYGNFFCRNSSDRVVDILEPSVAYKQFADKHKAERAAVKMYSDYLKKPIDAPYVANIHGNILTVLGEDIGYMIFHSQNNHDKVELVQTLLDKWNVRTWTDERGANANDSWKSNFLKAIRCARGAILIATNNALKSDDVKFELEHSYAEKLARPDFKIIVLNVERLDEKLVNITLPYKDICNVCTTKDISNCNENSEKELMEETFVQTGIINPIPDLVARQS